MFGLPLCIISANFNYCPIVWHFCDVNKMRKIEKLQERALRYLLQDNKSDYAELIRKSRYETLHLRRLKTIATEVFKSLNGLNPQFMKELFKVNDISYGLRDETILTQPKFKKITYGYNTFSYYGAHLWNKLPRNLKGGISLHSFKTIISKWEGPNCNCTLCNVNMY